MITKERMAEISWLATLPHAHVRRARYRQALTDLLAHIDGLTGWRPIDELKERTNPFLAADAGPEGCTIYIVKLSDGHLITDSGHLLASATHFRELPAPPPQEEHGT